MKPHGHRVRRLVGAFGVLALLVSACSDRSDGTADFFGGASYNPFVGIQQSLVSQTNLPLFVAQVRGDVSADELYWQLVTLDAFDGTQWHIGREAEIVRPDESESFEPDTNAFLGPTTRVTQDITVLALQSGWLPATNFPVALSSPDQAVNRGLRVKTDDGALRFNGLTYREMTYTVQSFVPRRDFGDDFAAESEIEVGELEDAKRFLDLPIGFDPAIRALAAVVAQGLESDFEKALALEAFFRAPTILVYSTAVSPGHSARGIAAWLLDPTSDNYRIGYCEQFATAMAVMARTLGIPSRVVLGFRPGTLLEDGRVEVRDRDSHAWVELWMPSQGWVRFDPTPRPATFGDLPVDINDVNPLEAATEGH